MVFSILLALPPVGRDFVHEFGNREDLIVQSCTDLQAATQVSRVQEGEDSLCNQRHSCYVQLGWNVFVHWRVGEQLQWTIGRGRHLSEDKLWVNDDIKVWMWIRDECVREKHLCSCLCTQYVWQVQRHEPWDWRREFRNSSQDKTGTSYRVIDQSDCSAPSGGCTEIETEQVRQVGLSEFAWLIFLLVFNKGCWRMNLTVLPVSRSPSSNTTIPGQWRSSISTTLDTCQIYFLGRNTLM